MDLLLLFVVIPGFCCPKNCYFLVAGAVYIADQSQIHGIPLSTFHTKKHTKNISENATILHRDFIKCTVKDPC
jgi:hypothetical protein